MWDNQKYELVISGCLTQAQRVSVEHRQDQLRGKNEVGYQHSCRADPRADLRSLHSGQPDTSVDPDTSSIPSRMVLLLSDLYKDIYISTSC